MVYHSVIPEDPKERIVDLIDTVVAYGDVDEGEDYIMHDLELGGIELAYEPDEAVLHIGPADASDYTVATVDSDGRWRTWAEVQEAGGNRPTTKLWANTGTGLANPTPEPHRQREIQERVDQEIEQAYEYMMAVEGYGDIGIIEQLDRIGEELGLAKDLDHDVDSALKAITRIHPQWNEDVEL